MDDMLSSEPLIKDFTENYMEKIFYFCLKKTGNEQEAENLTSDIAVNIISALAKGTVPCHFSAWVWQIARNRYCAWAARMANRSVTVICTDISDYEIEDGQKAIDEKMIQEENLALLRRELAFLSSDYRNILIAYYIEDMTTRSIAQRLNLPRGTVEARLSRARKKLKEGMDMAREFGPKSYNPENITFAATGYQPSGLPWSAVQRRLPRNILLEASNNPSTAEELSMALGIPLPYMEEEIYLLKEATLLKKERNKYVTSFLILDRESQLQIYKEQHPLSLRIAVLLDALITESLPEIRATGIVHSKICDGDLKWWVVPYTMGLLLSQVKGGSFSFPERENDENWGFIGYEDVELPENCRTSHDGICLADKSAGCGIFSFSKFGLPHRREMQYEELLLLCEALRNKRGIASFTPHERNIWKGMENHFAHAEEDGEIVADLVVLDEQRLGKIIAILRSHPLYDKILNNIQEAYDKTLAVLSQNNPSFSADQLSPYAHLEMYRLKGMAVNNEIESGRLIVPEDPMRSTAAMYLNLDLEQGLFL